MHIIQLKTITTTFPIQKLILLCKEQKVSVGIAGNFVVFLKPYESKVGYVSVMCM